MEKKISEKNRNIIMIFVIAILCIATIMFEFISIQYTPDEFRNKMIGKSLQQCCGIGATVLLMIKADIKLFKKPQNILYLIPCLIIAIDNFPFWAYFSKNLQIVRKEVLDWVLFSGYCLSVGIFEECIFRGIIFSVLASRLSRDRKGFLLTYVLSSFIFGAAHLLNGFSAATILQIGYTTLTGGLFAFALIKTRNIFCCGAIHAIYNFCGLLLIELGNGFQFDVGTTITMAVVSIVVGAFVLYKVYKCPNTEIKQLYADMGIKFKETE